MSLPQTILAGVPLFQNLPDAEIHRLMQYVRPLDLPDGAVLFEEGELGNHLYVIQSGNLQVVKAMGTPDENPVGVRGPGEYVGEMSLLNSGDRRSASIRALGDCRLLEISRADFESLLAQYPRLAYNMVNVLSKRLSASHNTAIEALHQKNLQLQRAYDELKAAQEQLVEKKKLEHELTLAYRIQKSILPKQTPALEGYDFGVRLDPMRFVGGDFYDFIELDSGLLGIAVGDVSGHGVPAALFMALTMTLLRAEACREVSLETTLLNVNRQLMELNSEGMFVTMIYGVLNAGSGHFRYVRAGHPLPILCSAAGELSEVEMLPGMALGMFDSPYLNEQEFTFAPGDSLLLYTDGLTEAMDSSNHMFGEDQLGETLRELRFENAQQVCEGIFQRVAAFSYPAASEDDLTSLCVRAGAAQA